MPPARSTPSTIPVFSPSSLAPSESSSDPPPEVEVGGCECEEDGGEVEGREERLEEGVAENSDEPEGPVVVVVGGGGGTDEGAGSTEGILVIEPFEKLDRRSFVAVPRSIAASTVLESRGDEQPVNT